MVHQFETHDVVFLNPKIDCSPDLKSKAAISVTMGHRCHYLCLMLLLYRSYGLDGAIGIVMKRCHFHVTEVGFSRELHVVIEQIPFAVLLNNRMVIGPALNGIQHNAFIDKRTIRAITH